MKTQLSKRNFLSTLLCSLAAPFLPKVKAGKFYSPLPLQPLGTVGRRNINWSAMHGGRELNPEWVNAQMIQLAWIDGEDGPIVCKTLLPLFRNHGITGRRFTAKTITFENGYKMLEADKEIPKYIPA